ncbi:MAG: DUF5675 family protein [Parabacteroides sp.]
MEIILYRTHSNRLYTEGELFINGNRATFTVESSDRMLPVGTYALDFLKRSCRKQQLVILGAKPSGRRHWSFATGNSYRDARKRQAIVVGEPLIPGVVYRSQLTFLRLVSRLTKCRARGESITFEISEARCRQTHPIRHWL